MLLTPLKLKHYQFVIFLALTIPWICGALMHNSWFRPWSLVAAVCAVVNLLMLLVLRIVTCYGKFPAGVLSVILVVYGVVFGSPSSSSLFVVELENTLTDPLTVSFKRLDKPRSKILAIDPLSTVRFVYFYGEGRRPKSIPCQVTVRELTSGTSFEQTVALPVVPGQQNVLIFRDSILIQTNTAPK